MGKQLCNAVLFLAVFAPTLCRAWHGIVEGFYWRPEDSVHGCSREYPAIQRQQALDMLSVSDLDTYIYAPHEVDLVDLLDDRRQEEWRAMFAYAHNKGIRLVYGIRPRKPLPEIDVAIMDKVEQLRTLGCQAYALCFDDVPGGATAEQMEKQAVLVQNLQLAFPSLEIGFLPGSYHGPPQDQKENLAFLDDALSKDIPMLLTGTDVNPASVALDDFPALDSGRRIVFYDNWAAVDTNTRLPWSLGRRGGLPGQLFADGEGQWGYVLNPCFPLERCIHQFARVGQMRGDPFGVPLPDDYVVISLAAGAWASWLLGHDFIEESQLNAVLTDLERGIERDDWFGSMGEMEARYPALKGVFTEGGITCPAGVKSPPCGNSI